MATKRLGSPCLESSHTWLRQWQLYLREMPSEVVMAIIGHGRHPRVSTRPGPFPTFLQGKFARHQIRLRSNIRTYSTAAGPATAAAKRPPSNIFSFFDDIGKIAVSRPSFRLELGVAAYPKTALSGASRKQQIKASAGSGSSDSDYLSVGVGEDAYFRRHDAIGVADGETSLKAGKALI